MPTNCSRTTRSSLCAFGKLTVGKIEREIVFLCVDFVVFVAGVAHQNKVTVTWAVRIFLFFFLFFVFSVAKRAIVDAISAGLVS